MSEPIFTAKMAFSKRVLSMTIERAGNEICIRLDGTEGFDGEVGFGGEEEIWFWDHDEFKWFADGVASAAKLIDGQSKD